MNYLADLDIFLEDAVPAQIGEATVQVLFSDPSKNLVLFDREVNSTAPFCVMKQADVLANDVENGTTIIINDLGYDVVNVAPDGAGLAVVTLTNAP
ncbi:MAG TPA: hypothetical protein DCP69_10275 [Candidatus Omnitrophica bacterium]|nr:hypothetical protein [Candidatus Omnitrophota bacterium]